MFPQHKPAKHVLPIATLARTTLLLVKHFATQAAAMLVMVSSWPANHAHRALDTVLHVLILAPEYYNARHALLPTH